MVVMSPHTAAPLRIVFLDFDGVLNSEAWFRRQYVQTGSAQGGWRGSALDPGAIVLLNQLLARSGAACVITSVWRYRGVRSCRDVLRRRGFAGRVLGVTPHLDAERGHEIQAWLDHVSRPVERFVILDDDSDMAHLYHRLVQTDARLGLTQDHVDRAVRMLDADEPTPTREG